MCLLITCDKDGVLISDVMTKPAMSIIRQSFCSQERAKLPNGSLPNLSYEQSSLNGDGYGVGWYSFAKAESPCLLRSIKPAWNDPNLDNLSTKVRSPVVMAHVRAAGPGSPVGEGQVHPFQAGRFLFMHNGLFGDYDKTQRELLRLLDSKSFGLVMHHSAIDSVVAFALFLTHLTDNSPDKGWDSTYEPQELLVALEQSVNDIIRVNKQCGVTSASLLNFVVTDGSVVLATRIVDNGHCDDTPSSSDLSNVEADTLSDTSYSEVEEKESVNAASLYLSTGSVWKEKKGEPGNYHMEQSDRCNRTVIITSEPLSTRRDEWMPIPPQNIVMCTLARAHIDVTFVPYPKKPAHVGSVIDLLQMSVDFDSENATETLNSRLAMSYTAHTESVTCVASCGAGRYLVSGSQDGAVILWDLKSAVHSEPRKHAGPVLAVLVDERAPNDVLLFSSSQNELRVWDLSDCFAPGASVEDAAPVCLYVIKFASARGGLLSLCGDSDSLYLGFQTPQIFRLRLRAHEEELRAVRSKSKSLKFFTVNVGKIGQKRGHKFRPEWMVDVVGESEELHNGFVYALCKVGDEVVSGGGDGRILVWRGARYAGSMMGHTGGVTSLISHRDGAAIISGSFDSTIREWDLETRRCLKTLRYASDAPVFSIAPCGGNILAAVMEAGQQRLCFWGLTGVQPVHHSIAKVTSNPSVLHVLDVRDDKVSVILGGEAEGQLRVVTLGVPDSEDCVDPAASLSPSANIFSSETVRMLMELVAIPSVSSDDTHASDCRTAAQWMAGRYEAMGCTVMSFSTDDAHPVVVARLGWNAQQPTVVLYAHYDVVPAGNDWGLPDTPLDPFTLVGHDGYLYGRGASDNKGPAVAHIRAVQNLQARGRLDVNVLFVCDGDEENLSGGYLEQALEKARHAGLCEGVQGVVVTNSNWVDDDTPCICYGSRGVVDLEVTVSGPAKELHAGSHGGFVAEPLHDLVAILGHIVDSTGNVLIPSFYDNVISPTAFDDAALLAAAKACDLGSVQESLGLPGFKGGGHWLSPLDKTVSLLRQNWLQPAVCITDIHTERDTTASTRRSIARTAVANVSFRTVPGQETEKIVSAAQLHLDREFERRRTPNLLSVAHTFAAPWWQCDIESPLFKCSKDALERVWNVAPLVTREGGTMRVLSTMGDSFGVDVVQIPIGQSTDNPHLPNERIRVTNLLKGVDLVEDILTRFPSYLGQQPARATS